MSAQTKTVLVLVDLSTSTATHRKDYEQYFKMILDTIKTGDTVLVARIIKHPSAEAALAMPALRYETSKLLDLTANTETIERRNRKLAREALQRFTALLQQSADETPILELLSQAPRLFASFPAERHIIVFLSDMLESSRAGYNFESRRDPPTSQRLEAMLAKLEKSPGIADLKGVRIYVAGARDADARRLQAVRGFWFNYFAAAGASLRPEHYGGELLKFDECPKSATCRPYFQQDRHLSVK